MGYQMIPEKSRSLPEVLSKLRMDPNRSWRTISLELKRKTPEQANYKSQKLPEELNRGEKENKTAIGLS